MSAILILVMVLLWPLFALWRGYVAHIMWGWFIPWYPAPSIYLLVGIMMVISIMWPWRFGDDGETVIYVCCAQTFVPALLLGFGAFWKWLQWGL